MKENHKLTLEIVNHLAELRENAERALPNLAPWKQFQDEASHYLAVLVQASQELYRAIEDNDAQVIYQPPQDCTTWAVDHAADPTPPLVTRYMEKFHVPKLSALAHYAQVIERLPCLLEIGLVIRPEERTWLLDQHDHQRPRVADVWQLDGDPHDRVTRCYTGLIEVEKPDRLIIQIPRTEWDREVKEGRRKMIGGYREAVTDA